MPQVRLLGPNGRPIPRLPAADPRPPLRARYDAAITDSENRRHWANADGFSARSANTPEVRRTLRRRARYEAANNSYARGIIETLANDTIGTGPRLQLLTPDAEVNRAIEKAFACWTTAIGLPAKLRTMRKAKAGDGEAFGRMITNPRLRCPVKLDLRTVEADQVADPLYTPLDVLREDGIQYDGDGNPVQYHVLPYHPGDMTHLAPYGAFDRVDASLMVHWFRVDRPGQTRGVPEIMPALPLFAQLRRFTLAALAAAETAADFAAVIYSELPPDTEEGAEAENRDFEQLEIAKRMMTTLPQGWKMGQFKAEQPATTYQMFKHEILNEIARCLNMPFNVAAGNSSGYNYSSGRLDHQVYYKSLKVDRSQAETVVLDPLLEAWIEEAALVTDLVPDDLDEWPHQWFWDGAEHVDPEKEANAQGTRLANRTTSYAREYAQQGRDWETEFGQIAAEQERLRELGIAPPALSPAPAPGKAKQDPPPDDGAPNDDPPED